MEIDLGQLLSKFSATALLNHSLLPLEIEALMLNYKQELESEFQGEKERILEEMLTLDYDEIAQIEGAFEAFKTHSDYEDHYALPVLEKLRTLEKE